MTPWRAELRQLTQAGVSPRYPWREWLSGDTQHLVRGLDYHVPTRQLQANAAAWARRNGLKLRSVATETGCTLVAIRNPMTREKILEICSRMAGNGLAPGTQVYAPDHMVDELRAEGINAAPAPDWGADD